MAVAFTAGLCTLAAQDVVGQLGGITMMLPTDIAEITNLGSGAFKERMPTLADASVTLKASKFDADESVATSLSTLLWDGSVHASGTGIYVLVWSRLATPSAAAPRFTMNVVIPQFSLGGDVGAVIGVQDIKCDLASGFTRAEI